MYFYFAFTLTILGVILDHIYEWPYLAYFGASACAFIMLYWLINFIYAWIKK